MPSAEPSANVTALAKIKVAQGEPVLMHFDFDGQSP